MESLRTLQWKQLCEAEETLKAAHRNAKESADLYIWFWLLACMQLAEKANSPGEFDRYMRQPSSMLLSGEVSMLCRLLDVTVDELLEKVRENLQSLSWPFEVQVYRSKQEPRALLITIPNPGGETKQ